MLTFTPLAFALTTAFAPAAAPSDSGVPVPDCGAANLSLMEDLVEDEQAAGMRLLKCWHPTAKHRDTSVEPDWGVLALVVAAFVECVTYTGPFATGTVRYRGGLTSKNYFLNFTVDVKITCGDNPHVYTRYRNTYDTALIPPGDCRYERWSEYH